VKYLGDRRTARELWLDFWQGQENCIFSKASRPALDSPNLPFRGTGDCFSWGKRAMVWSWPLRPIYGWD